MACGMHYPPMTDEAAPSEQGPLGAQRKAMRRTCFRTGRKLLGGASRPASSTAAYSGKGRCWEEEETHELGQCRTSSNQVVVGPRSVDRSSAALREAGAHSRRARAACACL